MKGNAIVRIVVFSIAILVLLGILLGGLAFDLYSTHFFNRSGQVDSSYTSGTGEPVTVDASDIQDIEIDWVSGTITIQTANVDTITFTESTVSDERYAMVWKQEGDKLSIEFCEETVSLNFGITINSNWNKDLVITVPVDWAGRSLEIDCASSDVEVTGLTVQEVEIDAASAECRFENCTMDNLDVDTASGDVKFDGILNVLDFDGASASFIGIFANVPSRITMDSMSGDLDITLPADAGFQAKMDGISSNFSSEFPTVQQNGTYVCGDESCRITCSAMSGNVTIHSSGSNTACPIPFHQHTQACFEAGSNCPAPEHTHGEECCIYGDDCTNSEHSHSHNYGQNHH